MKEDKAVASRAAIEGEIGILARRKIEAGIIAPIYEVMCEKLGEEFAQSILDTEGDQGHRRGVPLQRQALPLCGDLQRNGARPYRPPALLQP